MTYRRRLAVYVRFTENVEVACNYSCRVGICGGFTHAYDTIVHKIFNYDEATTANHEITENNCHRIAMTLSRIPQKLNIEVVRHFSVSLYRHCVAPAVIYTYVAT